MSESTMGQAKMESESTIGQGKGSDLISRQTVLNIIDWVHYHHCIPPSQERLFDYLKDIILEYEIENAPTIDAVPVVRCKDCKWHSDGFCNNFNVIGFGQEDYCSMGERSEE